MNLLDYDIKRDFFNKLDNSFQFDVSRIDFNVISHIIKIFNLNTQYKKDYYSKLIKHYKKSKDFYDNLSFV